jgi:acyl-CoA thioesterase
VGTYAPDLTCQRLGIEIAHVVEGRASLRMRVADWMLNGHGVAHGGVLFTLADAAFAYASNAGPPGRVALAQAAQITFLRPAAAGDELLAEAAERTQVGRVGVYDVTVRRSDGDIVAEFRGQSALLARGSVPASRGGTDAA